MLYEIRDDIQPSQHQQWKGVRGAWRVQHCLLAFYSALFAGNGVNAESVSAFLQLLVDPRSSCFYFFIWHCLYNYNNNNNNNNNTDDDDDDDDDEEDI